MGTHSTFIVENDTSYQIAVQNPLEGDIERLITLKAQQYDLQDDLPLLTAIAEEESQLNPKAQNPKSSAKGIYQILDSTWGNCKGDPLNAEDNIECAMKLYKKDGVRHWCADPSMRYKLSKRGFRVC